MAKKKKTTKPRTPSHVKEAVWTLKEHTECEVEAVKEEGDWVLLLSSDDAKLPEVWKGLPVRRT